MLNKFISGLVFGLGFAISLMVVASLYFLFVIPNLMGIQSVPANKGSKTISIEQEYPYIENFHKLPLDEKIKNSTAIIVTKISKNEEGVYQSTVSDILKKQDDVELYYKPGDVYNDHGHYNDLENGGRHVPKGFIIFMGGNPAEMRFSTSYSGGDRISSLGDIPMALFRKKCEESDNQNDLQ